MANLRPALVTTVAAALLVALPLLRAAEPSPDPRVAEVERKLAEARARIAAEQAAVPALERELAQARAAITDDRTRKALAGDAAALSAVLEAIGTESRYVSYDDGRVARAPDPHPLFAAIDTAWPKAGPVARAKFVWLLGVNASPEAAARLRALLTTETAPDLIGNAIFALSRCAPSPDDVPAVARHVKDERSMTHAFGFNPHGRYGPGPDGKAMAHKPLGTLAREFVERRAPASFGATAATTPGELTVQPATIHCAGFVWDITGDADRDCTVKVAYRKTAAAPNSSPWTEGPPFIRCESWPSADPKYPFEIGQRLAGSIFHLAPDTEYEVRLTLADPDGGAAEKIVKLRTTREPEIYAGLRTLHVVPGDKGGSGTVEDPYKGIATADAAAKPGDVLLLAPGKYSGSVSLKSAGEPGKPIVWRGADVDTVVLDGSGEDSCLGFSGLSHLQFEHLTFTGANQGCIKSYGAQDVVVRRCKFLKFRYGGIVAQGQPRKVNARTGVATGGRNSGNWFVLDNVITGPKDWAKERGGASSYGVNLSGERNVIAYNRITDCWDCISLTGDNGTLPRTGGTDVYANDLRQGADDGVEADYTQHNVRVYRNRLTNTFSSLSAQPTFGGPTYFLYNAMYNTTNKPFKFHVNSTGLVVAHNTAATSREAFYGGTFHQSFFRNNLLLGLPGETGFWLSTDAHPIDMDYGGYNLPPSPGRPLISLNNVRYRTMADATTDAGLMPHAVQLDWDVFTRIKPPPGDDVFADPADADLTLRPGSKAVDAGVALPGLNDGYAGKAPDLGCYELGQPVPHYGPRPATAR